jgi:hypothetical protein
MATKAKVKAIAKKQSAVFTEGTDREGFYWACVTLPEGKMWQNGYDINQCHKSQGETEDLRDLWQAFEDELSCPITDG